MNSPPIISGMIGVIADDLTGAAELGAVGQRHGLRAEVLAQGEPSGQADLVCIDTDSRSCKPEEAGRRAAAAAKLLLSSGASWIYKKVDSVLRGHVQTEIEAILGQLHATRALLVPANPSLGRIIRDGHYFVLGRPIHETEFRHDPEYPRTVSKVKALLDPAGTATIHVHRVHDRLPATGIIVGEVGTADDLQQWVVRREPGMLLAGAAEFFGALLAATGHARAAAPVSARVAVTATRELFVCGTTSGSAREFIRESRANGVPVFSLPAELERGADWTPTAVDGSARQAAAALASHGRVILNIGLPPVREPIAAGRLAVHLTRLAERVLRQAEIGHVYAEGGATAAELLRRMNWTRLTVLRELAAGVATLEVQAGSALLLTIKPGSYVWPKEVRNPRSAPRGDGQIPRTKTPWRRPGGDGRRPEKNGPLPS